jgi:hypothetical protein
MKGKIMRKALAGFLIAIALMIAGQLVLADSYWNSYWEGRGDETETQRKQYEKCHVGNYCTVNKWEFFVNKEGLK